MRADHGWRLRVRRTLRAALVAVLALLVLGVGYVGHAAVRHARVVTLPAPTGPYRVGRVLADWTDSARADPFAGHPARRELSVWLWYPTPAGTSGPPAAYAPGAWSGLHFGAPVGWGETDFDSVRTHSVAGAPVAAGRFPVVVLEPGMGFAAPQYTTLAENLASHGYLVAGVTPTYSANLTVLHGRAVHSTAAGNPPFDGTDLHGGRDSRDAERVVRVWAADARFAAARTAALDRSGRFAGHVDPRRTTYLGHSFGGAAALEACRLDPRCAGAADIDGTQFGPVVRAGLRRPMMLLGSQDSCVTGTCSAPDAESRSDRAVARTLLAASTGPVWCYELENAAHFNFSDYGAYYLAAPLRDLLALGAIDGDRGLAVTGAYLAAFVDHTVRSRVERLLAAHPSPYPEVRVQRTPARPAPR